MHAKLLQSCPTLCDLWTVAHQASLSVGFSGREYQSGLLCPPPGDLPIPGTEPVSCDSCTAETYSQHRIWARIIHWYFFSFLVVVTAAVPTTESPTTEPPDDCLTDESSKFLFRFAFMSCFSLSFFLIYLSFELLWFKVEKTNCLKLWGSSLLGFYWSSLLSSANRLYTYMYYIYTYIYMHAL